MIHCIFISCLPDSPVAVPARFGERKYRSEARMIFFQPTPQGPDLVRVHRTRDYLCRVGNKIYGCFFVVGFCVDSLDNLPDLFAIAGQMLYFCNF